MRPNPNTLKIKALCVQVEGQELIHNLNLTIPEGEVHALLGPNGCGKTTLIMAIMGFPAYEVSQGQIFFEGRDITELGLTERARLGIGLTQQRPPTITGVRLQHIIDYVISNNPQRSDEIARLVSDFKMGPFLDRDIHAGLSGGEIKRAELFQLFVTHPRLALLDEPDSGIDMDALKLVGEMVNALLSKDPHRPAKRKTALIITHTNQILDYVPADKAHVMLDGRILCSGNPYIVINEIKQHGYEGCVTCLQAAKEIRS
ncbi:MAG: ABC transporter ATP-binding protein [Chloroflexota bacterium]|nr:ABC transporter ATP-binding protein [Chloroflexota bacterium]